MLRQLIESAWVQLQTNQFASGGLVLMVLGAILATFRVVPGKLWAVVRNRLMARLVVTSDTTAYSWVQHWLANHPYARRTRNVQLLTENSPSRGQSRFRALTDEPPTPPMLAAYKLSLGEGNHLFWWRARPVWVNASREKNESGATSRAYLYTISLSSLGMTRARLEKLIEEAREVYEENTRRAAGVWISRWEDDWTEQPSLRLRPLDSLVYEAEMVNQVIGDARRFLCEEARYSYLNIPFRRSYLLYGPPGTGKTSLVMALAHSVQRELCVLPLSRPMLDDQMLTSLMMNLPKNALVLIEDIDTIFDGRENLAGNQVTFSGLLNALDGAMALSGHMTVMTTNRRECLDPALVRPGRVDVQVEVGLATQDQAYRLFLRFFPGQEALAKIFADRGHATVGAYRWEGRTMAEIQEHCIRHMDDAAAALTSEFTDVSTPDTGELPGLGAPGGSSDTNHGDHRGDGRGEVLGPSGAGVPYVQRDGGDSDATGWIPKRRPRRRRSRNS